MGRPNRHRRSVEPSGSSAPPSGGTDTSTGTGDPVKVTSGGTVTKVTKAGNTPKGHSATHRAE